MPVQAFFDFLATPLACIGLGGYLPRLVAVTFIPLILMLLAAPLYGIWIALGSSAAAPINKPRVRAFIFEPFLSIVAVRVKASAPKQRLHHKHLASHLS